MTLLPESLTIASRGSRLALHQAGIVASLVRERHAGIEVRVVPVTTEGDRDQRPFRAIGGKGLFVGGVERELVEGGADVAVHSAKDLTAELAPGCAVVCVPERSAAHDVVVGGRGDSGEDRLGSLAPGAAVGTSSARRRALVAETRSDLELADLRGNLDTRLEKVARGDVAAGVVAAAGLLRLGRAHLVAAGSLDPGWWVPAPAQGALAVEALEARTDLAELFAPLVDPAAAAEVACERAFAARLEGGCSVPLGCHARVDGSRLVATGLLATPDGARCLRDRTSGALGDAPQLGAELAEAILAAGGDEILAEVEGVGTVDPSLP
jgi:hydroxymethylbilane synthase